MAKPGPKPIPAWDRFWAKVDATGLCWEWTKARTSKGYGSFGVAVPGKHMRNVLAHRWAWEALVGPIPEGMEIDHMCGNRICVNAGEHLALVTQQENYIRAWNACRRNSFKRSCPKGHPLQGENLRRGQGGWRRCATCHRETQRERSRRRRALRTNQIRAEVP
jgi:hypothetical protein